MTAAWTARLAERDAYVAAVKAARPADVRAWLTDTCPECGEVRPDDDAHVVLEGAVVVGCEGYWVVNPNAVGITSPTWDDWTGYR